MLILDEAVTVLTESPGNLVYFLVTLFALQQAFVSALTAARAVPGRVLARRWMWAAGGLLAARVALIIVGLLGVAGLVTPGDVLPPLERWVLVATALVLAWAALLGHLPRTWHTWALLGLLGATAVAYGVGVMVRSGVEADVAFLWGPFLWEQIGVLLAFGLTVVLALIVRPEAWEWVLGIALFWILGTVAQLMWGNPLVPMDGWQRLASLVALPLLSVLVHHQLLSGDVRSRPRVSLSEQVPLAEIMQRVGSARDLESALILASSRLAELLGVDICAVALDSEEADGAVQVVAIHPPTAAQMDPPRLPLADYEGIRVAFEEGQMAVAATETESPWMAPLYQALGVEEQRPLAVIPLRRQGRALGVLMLGGPQGGGPWREADLQTASQVSELLADAIASAKARGAGAGVRALEGRAPDEERDKLVKGLAQAKKQIDALSARIKTLVQEIKARDEEILALNTEAKAKTQTASEAELTVWQNEVRQLADEQAASQRKIEELTADRDLLLDERARLTEELLEVRRTLERVESHRDSLEEEIASLRSRLEASAEAVPVGLPLPSAQEGASVESEAPEGPRGVVGLVIADEDGQITMADALARRMLRLPVGDAVGMPINGAYPDSRWSQTIDDLLSGINGNGPRRAHLSLPVDDSTIEADLATLVGRDGDVDGLIVTLHSSDSDLERYEAITGLANEFRTPMTAITGYSDLLLGEQAGILTDMQQQFLERVKANVEQLNHLLNDLVQVASPDSRAIELSPQPVNLIEIIEEAVMGLAARFRERRLAVQLDLPSELSSVEADRDSLYQIMLRLLSNAVLCSEEGTQVVISAREEEALEDTRHLRISVEDTGGGIAPEDYPKVFRRFYRADQPLVEGMGETGVGMTMAKTLVEASGGRIWVESEPGVGSTFSFLLPVDG